MILTATVMKYIPTNAYFYVDDETKHGFLIDPGAQADMLLSVVEERGIVLEKILLTHGHFDHIGAVEEIRKKLGIPVIMGEKGREYAENPTWNLSGETGHPIVLHDVTYLPEGSVITLVEKKEFFLEMIDAPGHTTDGVLYYSKKDGVAFVGDTIFRSSYGRTDMYGGSQSALMATIREKVFSLPEDTVLLSGHSEPTTVGEEKGSFLYA